MRPTIEQLMATVGCQKFPERWQEIYDSAMADFEANGCRMTDPGYIDVLADRYGIIADQRELYKAAASSVAEQEPLARLLALLCAAAADTENRLKDFKGFMLAYSTGEEPNLGLNMLPGLALLSRMPECYENLCRLGLPEEEIRRTMRIPEVTVGLFQEIYGGMPGYHLLHWYLRVIDGNLFRVGRLEVEPRSIFRGYAQVFRSKDGQIVALGHERKVHASGLALGAAGAEDLEGAWEANVEETDSCWMGHPYDEKGLVSTQTVCLPKSDWEKVVSHKEPASALHIPADGRLDPDGVTASIEAIREFLQTYFPDHDYRAFVCNSWLMNRDLISFLGPDSNISKFSMRFRPLTIKSKGRGVFTFVFHKPLPTVLEELPENTRLAKNLKAHYLSGKVLHEMYGFILR